MADTQITPEIQALIDAGDANALNAFVEGEAKKQGLTRNEKGQFVSGKKEEAKTAEPEAKADAEPKEEIVYKQEVELFPGKSIFVTGASEAEVNAKAELVQTAAAAARAAAEAKTVVKEEPKKPALDQSEMFRLGTEIQAGKMEAIDEYVEKSGLLDRLLEKRGIKVDDLKATLQEKQTQTEAQKWQKATDEFKTEHSDYVGSKRNQYVLGNKIAELKNLNPDLSARDAIERAYVWASNEELLDKEAPKVASEETDGAEKTTSEATSRTTVEVPKKKATSSTMFGSDAASRNKASTTVLTAKQIQEATKDMDGREMAAWYNAKVKSGEIKPN